MLSILKKCIKLAYNNKRVYRIYCELELNPKIKLKRRIKRDELQKLY